jgi:hypothetical protein
MGWLPGNFAIRCSAVPVNMVKILMASSIPKQPLAAPEILLRC